MTADVVRTGYGQGTNPLSRECGLREGGASAAIATSHFCLCRRALKSPPFSIGVMPALPPQENRFELSKRWFSPPPQDSCHSPGSLHEQGRDRLHVSIHFVELILLHL